MESELRRELGRNRRLIVGLSLTSGAVGVVALPGAGELGVGLVRAFLFGRIARRRGVELPHLVALRLAGGLRVPSASRLAAISAAVVGMRLAWRRLGRALVAVLRFDAVGRSFLLGTYFEYYLVKYRSQSGAFTAEEAATLRAAMQQACDTARGHLVSALFRKSVSDLIRAGTFVPRTLWNLAQSALQNRGGEQVEQVVEEDVGGFFGRLTRLVEHELDAAGAMTLEALCAAFDAAWEQPSAETGASR